jgi:hypothetical protein
MQWNSLRDFPAIYVYMNPIYIPLTNYIRSHFNIILPSKRTPRSCMRLSVPTNMLHEFLTTPMCVRCSVYLILLDLTVLVKCDEYKLKCISSFLHLPS